jgi:hypothetical protein
VFDLTFTVIDREGGSVPLTLAIDQAVIAGWTGRDPVARQAHRRARSARHQAARHHADLLSLLGAETDPGGFDRSLRR